MARATPIMIYNLATANTFTVAPLRVEWVHFNGGDFAVRNCSSYTQRTYSMRINTGNFGKLTFYMTENM